MEENFVGEEQRSVALRAIEDEGFVGFVVGLELHGEDDMLESFGVLEPEVWPAWRSLQWRIGVWFLW